MAESALPDDQEPVIRIIPMPQNTNPNGDIFGGWIMSQVDLAGSIVAVQRIKGRMATVAVNSFVFKKPVFVGDLVSIYGTISGVGNTSVTVALEVYAERRMIGEFTGEIVKVTEAEFTYVAIDENRRPRPIPLEDTSKNGLFAR
ncbi:acyl-CoA thioesterase [Gammaproteobacteria bacterium]|nr:acyl-CoA thioesterase [Gammaproteobacteria bacterium]